MAEQREDRSTSLVPPVVMTDITYLQDPGAAFAQMRNGLDVVIAPTNGCARMTLSGSLLAEMPLDD